MHLDSQASAPAGQEWLRIESSGSTRRVCLQGEWTAITLTSKPAWRSLMRALEPTGFEDAWDLQQLQGLDHLGAQVLWQHWGEQWPQTIQMNAAQRALIERVAAFKAPPAPSKWPRMGQLVDALGQWVAQTLAHFLDFIILIGQLCLDILRLLLAPARGPWRDFSALLNDIGGRALGITAMVGFLIGVVLAYLMSQVLRQFGAETFIVQILGLALVRELGPLLAAVLIAGRSGSAITAQIGVMRLTEELDAMRVMGIPASFRLVLPRAMAMALAMPLIAVWTTLAALVGGILAADVTLGIGAPYFIETLPKVVRVANLYLAVGKSFVFGVLIALIGCHFGFRVEPNTESLGRGTTASVVASITAVILVDAIFAVVFKSVGMAS